MRYTEIINEVNHNPDVVKIDYDSLQTLIHLGLGQGKWGFGYADVNNYVALIGQVGHGIGKSGGIMNRKQQADPDSATKAIITSKDYEPEYGDDADKVAGAFNTTTGEISMNKNLVHELKPGVNRLLQANTATTIVHEMMHRGFNIISRTPKLVAVMPEDIKGYWMDDWGDSNRKYYMGMVQSSAEHAMIYTHELGAERFSYTSKKVPFSDLVKAIRDKNTAGVEELAGLGMTILYCRLDAVADKKSPIYGMRPIQIYDYWRKQFKLVNEGLKGHFQQSGPSRRYTRGGFEKDRAERKREQDPKAREKKLKDGKKKLKNVDLSPIINKAASLMGKPSVFGGAVFVDKIRPVVDEVFKDLPVSDSWKKTVAWTIADFVAADDTAGLNAYMKKIKGILSR